MQFVGDMWWLWLVICIVSTVVVWVNQLNRMQNMFKDGFESFTNTGMLIFGIAGLISEFVACVTSHNAPTIRVSRYSHWRGIDIERLLKRYGVKVWDRGLSGDALYFCVKRRQVRWAEYLLLRAGVPVTSVLTEPRNRMWAERYPPGSEPRKRKPRRR